MKRNNISIVFSLMLLSLVSACTEQMDFSQKNRRITVDAVIADNETRAVLTQESGTLNLISRWREGETVNLIFIQDGVGYKATSEPVGNFSADGKSCSFTFYLPGGLYPDRPYDVFGLCWVDGEAIAEEGKAYAKSEMWRRPFYNDGVAPLWFHKKTTGMESFLADFKHLGTYEVLHVQNNTDTRIDFNHRGFDVQVPWFKCEELTMLDDNYDPTQYVTEPGDTESGYVLIEPHETGSILSWYIPSGAPINEAKLMATINGSNAVTTNTISSSVQIQRGHAYHMYVTWNGGELKFEKVNDLLDELGIGIKRLEMEEDEGYALSTGREGHLSFDSTNPSVATAVETDDIGEPHVDILAHSIGTAVITITDTNTGQKSQIEVVVSERIHYAVMVEVGETECVTMKNASGNYEAYSEDVSLATCEVSGNKIYVTGVKNGETTIHVTETGTGKQYSISVMVYGGVPEIPVEDETFTVNGVTFNMKAVEGGTFWMGSLDDDPDAGGIYSDEKPRHQVTLSNFTIGETEVTQALWKAVMGSNYNPSHFKGNNLPVETISWDDACYFIAQLNALTGRTFRLPTEAEWEYAARGGKNSRGYKYAGSNNPDEVAWTYDNSNDKTHTVGTKKANELGLYDMSGNVWEWCQDWYGYHYYDDSPRYNPCNTQPSNFRIHRGGSVEYITKDSRVAMRGDYTDSYSISLRGLRLALSDGGGATPVAYKTCPDDNHPHMIDLGLPSGTLWACCNVGSSKPEDYGGYYAWGETEEKDYYGAKNYQFAYESSDDWGDDSDFDSVQMYYFMNIGSDISNTQYDVAHVRWGDDWCMATLVQIQELIDNCSSAWTILNGVHGRLFTGPNQASVFLPAAGVKYEDDFDDEGTMGSYWSSNSDTAPYHASNAHFMDFDKDGASCTTIYKRSRKCGLSVRPVKNSGTTSGHVSDEL